MKLRDLRGEEPLDPRRFGLENYADISGVLISDYVIRERVTTLGREIRENGFIDGVVLCVMKGAFMFHADLVRRLDPRIKSSFVNVSSYDGQKSTGEVKIEGYNLHKIGMKDVLVVEDVVDTGLTMTRLRDEVLSYNPNSFNVVTLLDKPDNRLRGITFEPDYTGFIVDKDHFVVGYGMDVNDQYRGLRHICALR
tara:strand:+ start:482 stop:1066 length:585 start_codon:yes stop_codon:yes gene_type:complete